MKKSLWTGMLPLVLAIVTMMPAWAADAQNEASGLTAFEASWKADRYVLAFFYSEMNDIVTEKQSEFESIAVGLKDQADAHFIDIKDPDQRDVVNLYKVDRAPMPLVLVVAPNGAITGGFPRDFTMDAIQNAIVGPLTTQCLKALQDGKFVFVSVPGDTEEDNAAAMKGVTDFTNEAMYSQITEVIIFNDTDGTEQRMLKSLGVEENAGEPVTAFLAPPGSLIGKFTGKTDKETLVSALTNKMKSGGGCCPGGANSGKGCN